MYSKEKKYLNCVGFTHKQVAATSAKFPNQILETKVQN